MWFSKKKMFALTLICTALLLSACGSSPKKIKVLILPKFEIGEMTGDMPGEAQLYYEEYLNGAEEYEIEGGHKDNKLYVKDDIAMLITGESKVNSALSLDAALRDERFDYSDAYIIGTGCAGSGTETTSGSNTSSASEKDGTSPATRASSTPLWPRTTNWSSGTKNLWKRWPPPWPTSPSGRTSPMRSPPI